MSNKYLDIALEKIIEQEVNAVLNKIRTEINELEVHYDNDYFSGNRDAMFKCNDILQIIDEHTK